MSPFAQLLAMFAAHAVCDYPLQGDFLAKAKNRTAPIPGVPWWQALGAHAVIHGGAVGLITGAWWLGVLEAAAHAITDDLKCRGRLTFNQDQAIHIACKLLWVVIAGLTLTACATKPPLEPKIVYLDVVKVVNRSCIPKELGSAPAYSDNKSALLATPGPGEIIVLLGIGREQRDKRLAEIEPIIEGCRD